MPFQTSQNLFCLFFFFNQPISCPTSSYFSGKTVSYRGPLQKPQSILQALYAPLSHTSKILMLIDFNFSKKSVPFTIVGHYQWLQYSLQTIVYTVQSLYCIDYTIDRNRSRTFYCVYIQEGYKHHLEKKQVILKGASISTTSKIDNLMYLFWKILEKKVYIFTIFSKFFRKFTYRGSRIFSKLLFLANFQCILEQNGPKK